jgi:general secretion pathway protein H
MQPPASFQPQAPGGSTIARRRRRARALTLVETLIVVAMVALLAGTALFGSGMLASNRMRSAAMLIVSGVRMGVTRANTTGRPVRMVFDLATQRVILEESASRVMLRQKEDEDNTGGGAEAATEAEQAARAEADRIVKGPRAPRASFSPVKQFGFDADDPAAGRELGGGIRYRQVQTEHDGQARSEGRAYLYFWPGGGTERASIQLTRDGDQEGLTVIVSPLTGRARIERGRVELPEARSDGEYSEREEEL